VCPALPTVLPSAACGRAPDGDGVSFGEWESPLACHAVRSDP
jgi:hypothetical protein